MMKKIYSKEWLELHPYAKVDSVDHYYISIANKIYSELSHSLIADGLMDDENRRYTSLCLAAWFEDLISKTGIWETFTAECKKRYGSYLPFYSINDDYYPDEINPEDIRFLLWHHMQFLHRDERIINPENPGIEQTAQDLYELLSAEYETAPENEKMQNFLCRASLGEEDFYSYREVLEWFHYECYFNIENKDQFAEEVENIMENKEIALGDLDMMIYGAHTELMLEGRKNLLSLPSVEWLALLAKRHGVPHWSEVKVKDRGYYLYRKEDDNFLFLKDLYNGEELKVNQKSLNLNPGTILVPEKNVLNCKLVYFGNSWWQCGLLVNDELSPKFNKNFQDYKAQKDSSINEKTTFHKFMKASKGEFFVFCPSESDIKTFIEKKMGYAYSPDLEIPDLDAEHGLILTASPQTGLYIQVELCDCIKSPHNPYYDPEAVKNKGITFFANPDLIPYEISCILQDQGLLTEATINSLKGESHGRAFIQKNASFLTDYFHYKCREKDFKSEDWKPWIK